METEVGVSRLLRGESCNGFVVRGSRSDDSHLSVDNGMDAQSAGSIRITGLRTI